MDGRNVGMLLLTLGAVAVVVGALAYFGLLNWFGKLPGDVRIQGERVTVYLPFASMILVSLVLSAVLGLLRRLLS